jgi:hypothetical protein
MKADVSATNARRFKDPKSYVTPDKREILHGEDWEDRKFELWQRARGQCEYVMHRESYDVRCLREGHDPHHKVLRSILRDDRLAAIELLCRHHHTVVDREQRQRKRDAKKASQKV